jgi:hypothetical protein
MFCQNCGKPLQEGEICTCQQAGENGRQPEQQADQDQQQYQQQGGYQQPYQPDPYQQQGQYQQPDPYQQQQGQYQQPDPYQQQPQYQQFYQQGPKVSGLAIAGFVVSLASIFLMAVPFGIVGIIGIILSAIALSQINKDPQNNIGGKGFAIAGLIISIIFAVISIIIYASLAACSGALGDLISSSYYW